MAELTPVSNREDNVRYRAHDRHVLGGGANFEFR